MRAPSTGGWIEWNQYYFSYLMCFLDTTLKKNFFYQSFLPDYASTGTRYSNEFKFWVSTETNNYTADYGDQPYSWGSDGSGGGGYWADGTRWKHVAITFPSTGAAPRVYINGVQTSQSGKAAITGNYSFAKNYGYNVHIGGCRQLRTGASTFTYAPPVSASIKDFQIYSVVVC